MKISIIGSGNLATHLAINLYNKKIKINEIFSKNIKNAKILAKKVDSSFTDNLKLLKEADLYIISVPDDKIKEVSDNIPFKNKLVIHTSGASNIDLINKNNNRGVFYPLQTFSKNKDLIDFYQIPILIETENKNDEIILLDLAKKISENVFIVNSKQREAIHVSAVFVSNFTNQMYNLAYNICIDNNIDFNIFKPLILETANKIKTLNPKDAQTGPARRNDLRTIEKHINFLGKDIIKKDIYSLITNSIINENNNN